MGSGFVVWFTGLPAAGKSTLARALAAKLRARDMPVETLDGDDMRRHLCAGLTFSREDRNANVARIAFVAHLLARNGVHVAVAAVSPFAEARQRARQLIPRFIEVHVATRLEECIRRDPKGLYKLALNGKIQNFTGIDDPYEEPRHPEIRLDTQVTSADDATSQILVRMGILRAS